MCFVFLNWFFVIYLFLLYSICRSHVRLQRIGDQLVSDISRIGANDEDLSIDIVNNGENCGLPPVIKHNVEKNDASPHRKRLHVEGDAVEESKQGTSLMANCFQLPEILWPLLNNTWGVSKLSCFFYVREPCSDKPIIKQVSLYPFLPCKE